MNINLAFGSVNIHRYLLRLWRVIVKYTYKLLARFTRASEPRDQTENDTISNLASRGIMIIVSWHKVIYCKNQLLVNKMILQECKTRKRNLSTAWAEEKKAFDNAPHIWMIKFHHRARGKLKIGLATNIT